MRNRKFHFSRAHNSSFDWVGSRFVADTEEYQNLRSLDGSCPFSWWSGLKHDCAKVMELNRTEDGFINGYREKVDIEEQMIYPLAKSSDISNSSISETRKWVIVTQHSTSEDTSILLHSCPKAYAYLLKYSAQLDNRSSRIYKNRPRFCMFGIGEYSFKPYKVAVSGLYKHANFSCLSPIEGKPVMLDDTCYLLGFDTRKEAEAVQQVLNHPVVQKFIHSLLFIDAKRPINKELLSRINLRQASIITNAPIAFTPYQPDLDIDMCAGEKI